MKNRRLQLIFAGLLLVVIAFWLAFQYLPTLLGGTDMPTLQSGESRELTLSVAGNLTDCNNGTTNRCLLVDNEVFYQEIQDFAPRTGCTYELVVEEYAIYSEDDTPRDTSRYRYRLLQVAERMCVTP